MAIGQNAVAGARVDCGAAQSEPEDVGGWLNSLSLKAFKGKGVLWKLRRATGEQEKIENLMQELQSISRAMPGKEMTLAIHKYKEGRVLIRWKRVGVSRSMRFEEAAEIWGHYAEPLRSWYATTSQQAINLNLRHRLLMASIRALRAQLPTMPVFPREPFRGS